MAIGFRERPVISGKDAQRFTEKKRKNNERLKRIMERKLVDLKEHDQKTINRYLRNLNKKN